MPRKAELDVIVSGDPEAVAERLKDSTRWSPQPYRGGPITFGNKPMKGRVRGDGAVVGLNERDWWSLFQPTADIAFEKTGAGTRVHGHVGMPDWLVWFLRGVVLLGLPAACTTAVWSLLSDGSPGTTAIAAFVVLFAVVVSVFGIGAHVHHANSQVDALKETVLQTVGHSGIPLDEATAALSEAMREATPTVRAGMDGVTE